MHALVTGAAGFIGKNLVQALGERMECRVTRFDLDSDPDALSAAAGAADIVYHLAGVNRPEHVADFETGNAVLTEQLVESLAAGQKPPVLVLSSSVQAALDNPYGQSKRRAEQAAIRYAEKTGAPVYIYRLPNVFGKWCRPNYNSVVATFCHNTARDLEIHIPDPARQLELVYIDDVISSFIELLEPTTGGSGVEHRLVQPTYHVTLGELASTIQGFRSMRSTLVLPDFEDRFTRSLYATYTSYLATSDFSYSLEQKLDSRGALAELLKSPHCGQIFVSRTRPGVTRGNHYHHTKVEKFCVLEGRAVVRLRNVVNGDVVSYKVRGMDLRVVDIPVGYTHSIENIEESELIVLFWASEVFDAAAPDTYQMQVSK